MDILLTKEKELYMQWDPQCTFVKKDDGTYSYESWHKLFEKARLISLLQPRTNVPPFPKTLKFSINVIIFRESNMEERGVLYEQLRAIIVAMKDDGDEIDIEACDLPKYKQRMDHKPEFEKELALLDKQNREREERAEILIDELRELGYPDEDLDMLYGPTRLYGPDEYYEWTQKVANVPPISVQCHESTRFYQFLKTSGLIERLYPEWYMKLWKEADACTQVE